jgi:hypothetical protein
LPHFTGFSCLCDFPLVGSIAHALNTTAGDAFKPCESAYHLFWCVPVVGGLVFDHFPVCSAGLFL